MYIALLVRVTALSVMSRIGNVLHRHPVFASAMDVIDEMYETIRLEHQRYSHLPLLRFPQGIVAITTTTSTAASRTSTPSTPITTTTATTPTTTASPDSATYTTTPYGAGSATAVVGPSTFKPPRECDWLIVYNLGKVLEAPYNLTSKAETTALRDAVSKARTSRRTLERLAETRPKQAGHANALGEVPAAPTAPTHRIRAERGRRGRAAGPFRPRPGDTVASRPGYPRPSAARRAVCQRRGGALGRVRGTLWRC
ncbi:hypothetical protein F4823DRAFT_606482 [Ustulina deusta]|nr:hypothetical protein F4823DRAFT_606482 [Ustulina deusta]